MSGGGARTRVKMRERAINVKSRLVLRETPDLGADEDDDQTQDEGAPLASANHLMSLDSSQNLEDGEEHGFEGEAPEPGKKQKTRGAQTEEEKEKNKKAKVEMSMIPTPPIFEDIEYDRQYFLPWRPPESLIKFVANTGSELNTSFDFYELRQDDLVWLRSYNEVTKPSRPVTEEQMECLLDLFEKEASYRSKLIDPVGDFSCGVAKTKARELFQLVGAFVEHIYEYWRARRKMLRKALMRKFQNPPIEPGPHVAFVPRVPSRRASSRNPRKNDASSYRKMIALKEDFIRVLDVITRLKRREVIKRHLVQLQVEEFDRALEKTQWAGQLAVEREAVVKKQKEARDALEEKKRQKQLERAGRPALAVDEHPEFPGYFLGPFFTFSEAYNVELQCCDSTKTDRENCAALLVSNIPRSNYVSEEPTEAESEAEKKDNRPLVIKRTKTTTRGGKPPTPTSSNTLTLPRPFIRLKRGTDSKQAVSEPVPSLPYDSSSSESEEEEDRASDEEYYSMLESQLVLHGRDPLCMSSFLSRALEDISLGVPALEKIQRNGSRAGEAVFMDESTDLPLSRHRTLQNFPWTPVVKAPLMTPLPSPVCDDEQELRKLESLDNYTGYCRGRISRCGRALFDIYWKQGKAELDPPSESENDVEEINLDSIDEEFTLHNGVIGKAEPPLIVHGLDTVILPE